MAYSWPISSLFLAYSWLVPCTKEMSPQRTLKKGESNVKSSADPGGDADQIQEHSY